MGPVLGVNGEGFGDNALRLNRYDGGQDAGKVGMQRAAGIGKVFAGTAVMMGFPVGGVVVAMLMFALRGSRAWNQLSVRTR